VAVVYYLSRSRHLEHPHFIEVPLANPEAGLYLRGQSAIPAATKGAAFAPPRPAVLHFLQIKLPLQTFRPFDCDSCPWP
jgi:hypothetical protein